MNDKEKNDKGMNDDFDMDKFNIDDINTEDYEPDEFNPLNLLELNDDKNKDFGIKVETNDKGNNRDEILVDGKSVIRNNKVRNEAIIDKKCILDSTYDLNEPYKAPEITTIMIGKYLLISLNIVLNSYGFHEHQILIIKLKFYFQRLAKAFVQGRLYEIETYIRKFRKYYILLRNYLKKIKLQNQIYFKRFSEIVEHYILLYKRMKKLASD